MEWSDHFSTAAKRTSKIGSGGGAAATLTWVSGAEELVISVRQAAAWCNISRYVVLAWMIQGTYQI